MVTSVSVRNDVQQVAMYEKSTLQLTRSGLSQTRHYMYVDTSALRLFYIDGDMNIR